ncbi:MAG TPA: LysM peptidoglycan-binding domain-containing protein [Herpetosiphonaceae bacterium]|nr:LysM peptidoglycan-binding domain-containing protein [Herpetosiphonaceae bacterium]
MSTLSVIALVGAFVIPIAAVALLRYLRTRMTVVPFYSLGALLFALAAAGVIWLVRSRVETVAVGGLTLIQPQGAVVALPPREPLADDPVAPIEPTAVEAIPTAPLSTVSIPTPTGNPTVTQRVAATAAASPTPSRTPVAPTATPVAPTATATPEPPTATPEPPTEEPEPEQRTYTVQPGDTLRSIAADFGVSVEDIIEANDLTAEQADSLQPGDTLIIP